MRKTQAKSWRNKLHWFFLCVFFLSICFSVAKLSVFKKDRFSLCVCNVHILVAVVAKINATKTMHLNLRSIGLMQHSLFTQKTEVRCSRSFIICYNKVAWLRFIIRHIVEIALIYQFNSKNILLMLAGKKF